MDELSKVLEPDEKIFWTHSRPLHEKTLRTKKPKINSALERGRMEILKSLMLGRERYHRLSKFYTDEQLLNFRYIDAITDRHFIQRALKDESFNSTPELQELLKPFTAFVEDFVKLDLSKLRKIKIIRKHRFTVTLDFNQGTTLDMDTLHSIKKKQLTEHFDSIIKIPEFEIDFGNKEELIAFLKVLKGKLSEKTQHATVEYCDERLKIIIEVAIGLVPLFFLCLVMLMR